ncbi:MAG: hypothetical protein GY772_17405 [bacterium]|nr:hypothetical protein [bacterium]
MNGANWWVDFGPFLALAMGVGAFLVMKVGDKFMRAGRTPRSVGEWYPVLEEAYLRVVHKNRELLEAVAHAEKTKKELPTEYQAILDQVIMLARLVEQASYEAAVENGTVPRYWFGGPPTEHPQMEPDGTPRDENGYVGPQLVDEAEGDKPTKNKIVALPNIASEWLRTQVIRKVV